MIYHAKLILSNISRFTHVTLDVAFAIFFSHR